MTMQSITRRSFLPFDTCNTVATSGPDGTRTSLALTEDERSYFEQKTDVPGFRTCGDVSRFMQRNNSTFLGR